MKLLDLFSGFGGVSVAAQASGLQIVEGVDADAHAAAAFAQNFPLARAKHAELGPGLPYEWPAPAPDLWVHASPPCTALSRANRSGAGRDGGLALTAWTVRQLVEREYAYFSVEQVSTAASQALFAELQAEFPTRLAFITVDAVEFGAAQRRRRLLAGPPAVLERFRTAPRTASKTIRQAFQAAGVALPEGATCVLNTNGDACSLDGPAFTVCATRALTWGRAAAAGTDADADADADAPPHRKRAGTVRCMTPAESAVLQGFPPTTRVAHNKRRAQVQLGNAVEFHTACALFRAGLRGTSPPTPPSPPGPPLAAVGQRLDRLEAALGKRVRDLEEEVRKLKASRNN